MEIKLGNLVFEPATAHTELLAKPVAESLSTLSETETLGVAEIDPSVSDTAAFCEKYGVGPEVAANCVIIRGKRGEERPYAACIILATTRTDVNGKVCEVLNLKKASFAPMEEAVSGSGMEFGAITPVGLPADWPILMDACVAASDYVIIGSGVRKSKLAAKGSFLASLPNAQVIEGLAQPRPQD